MTGSLEPRSACEAIILALVRILGNYFIRSFTFSTNPMALSCALVAGSVRS